MKSKDDGLKWIPLWIDKWIFGSTRIELKHDERAIWVDLMALAGKDNGYVRANPETPYSIIQLGGLLCCPEELLCRTIKRCIETGKIIDNSGIFYLINWEEFSLSERQYRRIKKNIENKIMAEKTDTMAEKTDTMAESPALIEKRREEKRREKHILILFEKFWENYPKKKSKGQAEKIFFKLKPDEYFLEKIISAIKYAKKSEAWMKESGKYIPHPATWLNAKGWEDQDSEPLDQMDRRMWDIEQMRKKNGHSKST